MTKRADLDGGLEKSVRHHLIAAAGFCALLIGAVGGWAFFTEIRSAVVAPGKVVVDGKVKQVQHRDGGIIREIHVRDGDRVRAGDLLVRLDNTLTRTNLAAVHKQLEEHYAKAARLVTERDADNIIDFSRERPEATLADNRAQIERNERRLMEARRASLEGKRLQLEEQIKQLQKQIEGQEAQKRAKNSEIALIGEELADFETLHEKQLVKKSQVTALRREKTQLQGHLGSLVSAIAQAKEAISERQIQIIQLEQQRQAEILEELQATRAALAQLEERRVAAEDRLLRDEIRTPLSGVVHQLAVHSVRGVASPGETLMLIVPEEDILVIEAHIQPVDIDQLSSGQDARIRFPSFNQRTTPELTAVLQNISADLMYDPNSEVDYYIARLEIAEEEFTKLNGKSLLPGMPVEAFIQTEKRTVASYFTKPLGDQIARALNER